MRYTETIVGKVTHLWLDLETTGLDRGLDDVIEIGAIGTDDNLDTIFEYEVALCPTQRGWDRLRDNDKVREMHERSGLLTVAAIASRGADDFADVMDEIVQMCVEHGAVRGDLVLSGSGSSAFDRQFLEVRAPHAAAAFFYRGHDVGIVRRAWARATGTYISRSFQGKPHRSLDDVRDHLAEARLFAAVFKAANESGAVEVAKAALAQG